MVFDKIDDQWDTFSNAVEFHSSNFIPYCCYDLESFVAMHELK